MHDLLGYQKRLFVQTRAQHAKISEVPRVLQLAVMDSLSIADVDAKVSALQAADNREIHTLLRQQNALAPISTLPTEVLCTIFVFVKLACKNVEIEDEYELLDWVKVTHVCHWWREVGIRACYLWNEIPLYCVEWATEMLARSKDDPLFVTGNAKSEDHNTLRLEPLHLARIHELNIQCSLNAPLQSIWRVCSVPDQPLPLHTFRLDLDPADEDVLFPDALGELESHLPSLRRILLSGCGINWNAPFLCNLTHLRLSDGSGKMECYRVDSFLKALKTMPMLEMLYFSKWTPADELELSTARNIPVITLPNLKFLAVVADMDPLGVILPAVFRPSILATCLYSYEYPLFISALSLIFSSLLSPPQPQIRTLEIRQPGNEDKCRIRFWPVALSQMDVSTHRVIPAMEITWTNDDPGIQEILFIFNQFCSENLVSLSLPQIPPMDAPTWARTFRTLSALEFININGKNAQSLFEALIYGGHDSTITFPSLLSISIEDMEPVFRQGSKAGGTLQDSLIGALIERYELGREIREIIFVNLPCSWNDFVCRIREVVVDVDVVEEEFWKARSRPTSRILYPTGEDEVDNMTDWMGFWA